MPTRRAPALLKPASPGRSVGGPSLAERAVGPTRPPAHQRLDPELLQQLRQEDPDAAIIVVHAGDDDERRILGS